MPLVSVQSPLESGVAVPPRADAPSCGPTVCMLFFLLIVVHFSTTMRARFAVRIERIQRGCERIHVEGERIRARRQQIHSEAEQTSVRAGLMPCQEPFLRFRAAACAFLRFCSAHQIKYSFVKRYQVCRLGKLLR